MVYFIILKNVDGKSVDGKSVGGISSLQSEIGYAENLLPGENTPAEKESGT